VGCGHPSAGEGYADLPLGKRREADWGGGAGQPRASLSAEPGPDLEDAPSAWSAWEALSQVSAELLFSHSLRAGAHAYLPPPPQ
jgi:hypothetical protein